MRIGAIFWLLLSLFSLLSATKKTPSLGRLYLEELFTSWDSNTPEQRQLLLDQSSEFDGRLFSDYWFAASRQFSQYQTEKKAEALQRAINLKRWFFFRPQLAAEDLSTLFYQRKKFDQLWQQYNSWPLEVRNYGRVSYYAAAALKQMGKLDLAIKMASNKIIEQPQQLDYYRILASGGWSKQLYLQLSRSLAAFPPAKPLLLRYLIKIAQNDQQRLALLHLYTIYWPDDAFSALQWLRMRPNQRRERLQFVYNNYRSDDFLVAQQWQQLSYGYIEEEKRRQWLNGSFTVDHNYDGIIDEKLIFIKGELQQRKIFVQNWEDWQLQLDFAPGEELQLFTLTGSKKGNIWRQQLFYERYPLLQKVQIEQQQNITVYQQNSRRLALSISKELPTELSGWASIAINIPTIALSTIIRNSSTIESYIEQQDRRVLATRITLTTNGLPLQVEEDSNLDGKIDSIRLPYENKGKLSWTGFARRRDHDADSYFETKEIYLQGSAILYSVDLDGDLKTDYNELPAQNIRSWPSEVSK